MLNIVLFGPPGSGKGTQSEKIIHTFGLIHCSTGDILRSEIANKTKLGIEAKKLMDKGELVPDEVVIGMIDKKISDHPDAPGFIFDGFPRTREQAHALKELLAGRNMKIDLMIALEVERQELIDRLLKRGKEQGRSDDNLETIENRINVYEKQTAPVMDFYAREGVYRAVDGMGSIDEIFDRIVKVIEEVRS